MQQVLLLRHLGLWYWWPQLSAAGPPLTSRLMVLMTLVVCSRSSWTWLSAAGPPPQTSRLMVLMTLVVCSRSSWSPRAFLREWLLEASAVSVVPSSPSSSVVFSFNTLKALTLLVHAVLFWCFHNPPNSDTDHRIFNMHMWSFCMPIHTGGLQFIVSSKGLL